MQTKDKLTMALSIFAFLLSIYATITSEQKSNDERKRTIRGQLTDVLGRLTSLQLDAAKLQFEAKDNPNYLNNVMGVLNQQNGFVLDQAVYLSEQIPNLVTTYELNTIAVANATAGNFLVAEKYYKKAIELAPNALYKSQAIRSYANYLFPQGRLKEGREYFREALALKGEDNMIKFQNGLTYQMWAVNEFQFARAPEKSREYFSNARQEFTSIDADVSKNMALANLEAVQKMIGWQSTAPTAIPAQNNTLQPYSSTSNLAIPNLPTNGETQ